MKIVKPFKTKFLSEFTFAPETIPFTNKEIEEMDRELSLYEQAFLDPDIERSLLKKNEILASFAISKAEGSSLTLKEAQSVYKLVREQPELKFVHHKLKKGEELTLQDYEKLEFFNIAKTFREYNRELPSIEQLSTDGVKKNHLTLTQGMDIFAKYLPSFTVYKSGKLRDNDEIMVGDYIPAPYKEIENGLEELIKWLKDDFSIVNIAIFHTAMYALHPFNNGNKRVCRILEHIMFRQKGLNDKNLYSTSYYYYKQRERYYKYLLYSAERKNLNHFIYFVLEAIVMSMIGVIKTSIESQRLVFVNKNIEESQIKRIVKPLVKRRELRFENLYKRVKRKMARQTFVTNLQKAVDQGVVLRRQEGRNVYYKLDVSVEEEVTMKKWLDYAGERLKFVPDEFMLA